MQFGERRRELAAVVTGAIIAGGALAVAEGVSAQSSGQRYVVHFRSGAAQAGERSVRARGADVALRLPAHHAVAAYISDDAVDQVRDDPHVVSVEVDELRHPMAQTVPYGISMVQADQVVPAASGSPKVAVIDSGLFTGHEDFESTALTGTDDSGTGRWYEDICGHGTHVAGTIAAADNDVGVVGVLPGARLHIIKVFDGANCEWTYSSNLVHALDAALDSGAEIVNMSLGGSRRTGLETGAFERAYRKGALLIAAAGNDGTTRTSYPAGYRSVISVAAVDSSQQRADFSQVNDDVELAAPGVGVLSTVPWHNVATLTVGDTTWSGRSIDGAAETDGTTGVLADGRLCDSSGSWSGQVVLCRRGSISFAEKVGNVLNGGGSAAVIYNNVAGGFSGTLNGTSTIPAISLSDTDGAAALSRVGQSATVESSTTQRASGYEAWDGTSMAAPHVAGVAALVWGCNPQWRNTQVRTALTSTAKDLGFPGRDPEYGHGLVQAKAALECLGCRAAPGPRAADVGGCSAAGTGG